MGFFMKEGGGGGGPGKLNSVGGKVADEIFLK